MKKVFGIVAKLIFAAFGVGMLVLLVTLTYAALQIIFPNNPDLQIWGLVLFDVAAVAWFLAFLFNSSSTWQYGVALAGFIIAFLGTLGMVGAEVMLSNGNGGQTAQEIGRWMNYIFIGVTALHVLLLYLHHFVSPHLFEQIQTGIARGEIVSQAIDEAKKQLDQEKAELAKSITADIVAQVKRDMQLYPIQDTVFDRRSEPRKFEQALPHPTLQTPGAPDDWGPMWKSSTDVTPTLEAYAWICLNCDGHNPPHTPKCSTCGQLRTNGSPVTAFSELPQTSKEAGQKPHPFLKSAAE